MEYIPQASLLLGSLYYIYNLGAEKTQTIEQILKRALKSVNDNLTLSKALYPGEQHSKLIQPFNYTLNTSGKKLRMIMAVLISQLLVGSLKPEVVQIGALIQLLHNSSLIIDDIEDQSLKRRDQPCSHLVYGIDNSINSANFMYFYPFLKILETQTYSNYQKAKFIGIFIEQMFICHLGQAQDILTHKLPNECTEVTLLTLQLPSRQDYIRMTSAKTGSLLKMMVSMIGVITETDNNTITTLRGIMDDIGISFQITDDILNIQCEMGKGTVAEDLYERKFTLIIQMLKQHLQFMSLFLKDRKDKKEQDLRRMIQIIKKKGVLLQCKKIASFYSQRAVESIKKLEKCYNKQQFIQFVRFIIQRKK